MAKSRRMVDVRPEDDGRGGSPKIWGYGYRWIAALAHVSVQRVREGAAGETPEFDPADPVSVVAWALRQHGCTAAAQTVSDQLARGA